MPKFRINATVVGGKYIGEFEADTAEKAIEMAEQSEKAYVSLCHHCTDQCEDPECSEFHAEEIKD